MDEKETGRLEAFSDGVFAVAITLLVLNIKIPGLDLPTGQLPDDKKLLRILAVEWPMLVAYATSFATIGVMWINHHRLFQHIKRIDTGLMLLNLLLLALIVFIPVPTALLAEYLPRLDAHTAAIVYTGTYVVTACCFNVLWRYASYHHRLLGKNIDAQGVAAISRQYVFGPVFYLVAFGLAWIDTLAAALFCFLLALFFALPGRSLPLIGGTADPVDAMKTAPVEDAETAAKAEE